MDLYDIAVARKLSSGGGGGGGRSDFSTAEVTIVNNTGSNLDVVGSFAVFEEAFPPLVPTDLYYTMPTINMIPNESVVKNLILYKGTGRVAVQSDNNVSANANVNALYPSSVFNIPIKMYEVTGDCTITIS